MNTMDTGARWMQEVALALPLAQRYGAFVTLGRPREWSTRHLWEDLRGISCVMEFYEAARHSWDTGAIRWMYEVSPSAEKSLRDSRHVLDLVKLGLNPIKIGPNPIRINGNEKVLQWTYEAHLFEARDEKNAPIMMIVWLFAVAHGRLDALESICELGFDPRLKLLLAHDAAAIYGHIDVMDFLAARFGWMTQVGEDCRPLAASSAARNGNLNVLIHMKNRHGLSFEHLCYNSLEGLKMAVLRKFNDIVCFYGLYPQFTAEYLSSEGIMGTVINGLEDGGDEFATVNTLHILYQKFGFRAGHVTDADVDATRLAAERGLVRTVQTMSELFGVTIP